MDKFFEGFGNGVEKVFSAIANFFIKIWNFLVGLLAKVFPRDFAQLILIVILAILIVLIFMALTRRGKR